jgi:hypothetical protein
MAKLYDKKHPTDADGNTITLSTWAKNTLNSDELSTYWAADQAYLSEIEVAGLEWNRSTNAGQITFPDTEEAFWASTPERTTMWNNLNVFLTRYKSDSSLNW